MSSPSNALADIVDLEEYRRRRGAVSSTPREIATHLRCSATVEGRQCFNQWKEAIAGVFYCGIHAKQHRRG